jgi:hypothetical protein
MTDGLEERGIISVTSRYSVAESVERIKSDLLANGAVGLIGGGFISD